MRCLLYISLALLAVHPSSQLQSPLLIVDANSTDAALDVSSTSTSTSTPTPVNESPPPLNWTSVSPELENLLNVSSELQFEKVNENEDCRRQLFISDKCFKRMIFLAKDSSLPRTLEQASFYCSAITETVDCLSQYKRCLNSFPRTLFALFIKDVRSTLRDICEDDQSKQLMVDNLQCFDDTTLFRKILDGWTKVLNYIADEVPIESFNILPNICCSYQYTVEINRRALERLCGDELSARANPWIEKILNSMVKSAFRLGCVRHNSLDACKQRLPRVFRLYKNLTVEGRRNPLPVTPVVPLLKLITKLNAPPPPPCNLTVRLLDGSAVEQQFKPKEPLASVRLFVLSKSSPQIQAGDFKIQLKIPPRTFLSDDDLDSPIDELGLCPNSRINAVRRRL